MGFLDELKDKAGDLGEKAKEGLGAVKDKASDLVEDVKERLDKDEPATGDPAGTVSGGHSPSEPVTMTPVIFTSPETSGLVGNTTFFGPPTSPSPSVSAADPDETEDAPRHP